MVSRARFAAWVRVVIGGGGSAVSAQTNFFPHASLQAVSFQPVKIDDPFWSERIRMVPEVTLPDLLDLAEEQGKIDNFRIVVGRREGKYRTYDAADSDITN